MTIGWGECLILLFLLIILMGFVFRTGYFRGKRHRQK